jgi:hypothetical protein
MWRGLVGRGWHAGYLTLSPNRQNLRENNFIPQWKSSSHKIKEDKDKSWRWK